MWSIQLDDLSHEDSRALVAEHLAAMHQQTPSESVHALGIERLRDPSVLFFTARAGGVLGGMAAIQILSPADGELKSMRTTATARGTGLGRLLLAHVSEHARDAGITTLWLETGSTDDFIPARTLYESAGFTLCEPFGDYTLDPLSVFMRRRLTPEGEAN